MRPIKFRAWDKHEKIIRDSNDIGGIHISGIGDLEHLFFMQFTGLTDKNGKEIYEGDVIQQWTPKYQHTPKAYKYGRPRVIQWIRADTKNGWNICEGKNVEVIGNIYENPELLERKI